MARDAKADLAQDATAIIEQIIEDNIARETIPNVACQLPFAVNFFPATVGAIEHERFSGLSVILRKEAADLLGLVVLREMDSNVVTVSGAKVTAAAMFDRRLSPAVLFDVDVKQSPAQVLAAAPLTTALPAAVDVKAQQMSIMLTNLAQLGKKQPLAVPTGSSGGSCPFPVDAGLVSKATTAMTKCIAPQLDIGSELACSAALMVRDAADGDDHLLPNDAQRFITALLVAGFSATDLKSNWMSAATKLAEDLAFHKSDSDTATDFCTSLGQTTTGTCVKDVTSTLDMLKSSLSLSTLDQTLAIAAKIVQDGCAAPPNATGAAVNSGSPQFGAKWCASNASVYITEISADVITVINDIRSKNYGAAAAQTIDFTQQLACATNQTAPECTEQAQTVYAFLAALAEYSIDAIVSGAPSAGTDAAFRQAAVALIEEEGGAGVSRSLHKNWAFAYVPEFSLREAWRPGHIGPSTGQTLAYPSIEMVRGRLPLSGHVGSHNTFYLNLHGSLIDPLGPFVEVGTRDPSLRGDSRAGWVFLAGLLVPRVDLEFGVPEFSKNLVVGLGGALRFFRAEGEPGAAHYCIIGSDACTLGKGLKWGNSEASLFVKYVP